MLNCAPNMLSPHCAYVMLHVHCYIIILLSKIIQHLSLCVQPSASVLLRVQVCCHTRTYVHMCMIRQVCFVSSYLCAYAHTTNTSIVLTRGNEIACNYIITTYPVYL